MLEQLRQDLIDSSTGLFRWFDREDGLDLYQTVIGWPLITTAINGFGSPASWPQDFGKTRSETFFRALRDISESWTAFYIKHQDDAYAEVSWTRTLDQEGLDSGLLNEFEINPADEGGLSFLGLFSERLDDMVVFTYAPGEFLRISLFGRMKVAVSHALEPTAE